MNDRLAVKAVGLACLLLLSVPASAVTLANCIGASQCVIPENISLQLPFTAISGDVIITDGAGGPVSDIFRIFNNLVNTGGGTGIGNLVFLYSSDDSTPLPDPSTWSANKVTIVEDPSGTTTFVGNGTTYLLGSPEPQTFGLFILAGAMAVLARWRSKKLQGDL
jgi:hypothetical protein